MHFTRLPYRINPLSNRIAMRVSLPAQRGGNGRFGLTRIASALSLAIALSLTACSKQESPAVLMQQAQQLEAKGDRKAAIIQLKNLLQQQPDDGEARLMLGRLYIETGEADLADIELRKAATLMGDKSKVALMIARSLQAKGDYKKSLDELTSEKVPNADTNPEVLTLRAGAYVALNRLDEAKSSLEAALKVAPAHVPAMLGLVRMALVAGDKDTANRHLDTALEKAPKDANALLMKGDMVRVAGDKVAAVTFYRRALEADPGKAPAYLTLASMAIEEGKFDDARKLLKDVQKAAPGTLMAKYLEALLAFREKKHDEAERAILEVLKIAPKHLQSNLLAGAIGYVKGNYAQAENSLKLVMEYNKDNDYARRLLAATLLKQKQPERAITLLEEGLRGKPDDAGMLNLLGEAYLQAGNHSKATDILAKAAQAAPADPNTRARLALSRIAGGDAERGMVDLESAFSPSQESFQAEVMLVMTSLNTREFAKAQKALEALEKKQPNNPLTFNLKAALAIAQEDNKAAKAHLEKAMSIAPDYLPAAVNLARLDLLNNQFEQGRKRLEAVIEKSPKNAEAMMALADFISTQPNKNAEVVAWLERARKADPTALRPFLALTQNAAKQGDMKKALAYAQEAVAAQPDSAEALDSLGLTQLTAGDKNQAIATFNKLVQLRPKLPSTHFRLAGAQAASGDLKSAITTLRNALALKPDFTEAQIALVELYLRENNADEALKVANSVDKLDAKSPIGITLQGDVYMQQKRYAEAINAYQKAMDRGPTTTVAVKLHGAQRLAGNVEQADAGLRKWLAAHPKELNGYLYFAESQLNAGNYKEAAALYETVLKQTPQNLLSLNNLAYLYQKLGDKRAEDVARSAVKIAPENPMILDTLAMILLDKNNTSGAIDNLKKALVNAKDNAEIRLHYAQALSKAGKRDEAKQELDRLLKTGKLPANLTKDATDLQASLK
ncbi:XrtA/PEP-CTERM system TPR-repeat protein PrsT [Chitinivorax sp. B]|uniref:XrtA/PEP-CTERM system TPR-repeat protein PrsT n=1 Tax=Chitinivorax sp. B TaxID=2502235 RepID=UPI0010F857C6|nr:XrtA/PEP-CTERM system TPR-repeat protein PrsT [Chitinivorax sp. B]